MKIYNEQITLQSKKAREIVNITTQVKAAVEKSGFRDGIALVSSLHSNSAVGAIPRLQDNGIRNELMAGNIIGIIAQRLVRRLCRHCRRPHQAGSA